MDPTSSGPTPRRRRAARGWLAAAATALVAVGCTSAPPTTPPTASDPRLEVASTTCAGVAPGATCSVRVALRDDTRTWGGVAFDLVAAGFDVVATAGLGATEACLAEAGPVRVAAVCAVAVQGAGDVATVTLRRRADGGASIGVANGVLLPYAGGAVALDAAAVAR